MFPAMVEVGGLHMGVSKKLPNVMFLSNYWYYPKMRVY
jgi:hypothetical protein